MLTMTRQQLRTAVARGLQESPDLPNDVRYAATEFAANTEYVCTNFDGYDSDSDVHAQCPMAAVGACDDPSPLPEATWEFIDGFDAALRGLALLPTNTNYGNVIKIV